MPSISDKKQIILDRQSVSSQAKDWIEITLIIVGVIIAFMIVKKITGFFSNPFGWGDTKLEKGNIEEKQRATNKEYNKKEHSPWNGNYYDFIRQDLNKGFVVKWFITTGNSTVNKNSWVIANKKLHSIAEKITGASKYSDSEYIILYLKKQVIGNFSDSPKILTAIVNSIATKHDWGFIVKTFQEKEGKDLLSYLDKWLDTASQSVALTNAINHINNLPSGLMTKADYQAGKNPTLK